MFVVVVIIFVDIIVVFDGKLLIIQIDQTNVIEQFQGVNVLTAWHKKNYNEK